MTNAICSVETCGLQVHAKGWCKGHYSQARNNGGDPLARQKVPKGVPTAYFQAHLMTVTPDCKVWPFGLDKDGYGVLKVGLVNQRVHALACAAWHGPRPPGHEAAHGPCHDRACFNGSHLSWETPAQQKMDMQRDGTLRIGAMHPHSVVTEADVREIRRLHAAGLRRGLIALQFGIHHNTVDLIVRRVSWRHVE